MTLDIDFVRQQFPAFSQPSLQGALHFENAGGSYACRQVIDRLTRFYSARKVQPYYPHAAAVAAGDEMDEARTRLAQGLGVADDELSFGPSTTQNCYVLAQAFRERLQPGDAIIVTDQDHEANSGPWRRLADAGISVREWKIDPLSGSLDPEGLRALLDERVRLVCFPHCSNLVAEINPVQQLTAMVREAGAWSCVDGVSHAPHGLPDVGALGADIYLFSAYKTYGPHQGIMTLRRELGEWLPNQGHFFNADVLYKRFTPAGPDHAQVAACAGMVDYYEALDAHHGGGDTTGTALFARVNRRIHDHEQALLGPLLDYLLQRDDLRLLGPRTAAARAPTLAFVAPRPSRDIVDALARRNVLAACGDFYAVRSLQALGHDRDHGAVRLSFVHYTQAAEVERLIDTLESVL